MWRAVAAWVGLFGARSHQRSLFAGRCAVAILSVAAGISAAPGVARGDNLFVLNLRNGGGTSNGSVGEYTSSGATVNASLITGLGDAGGVPASSIAASGSDLFITNVVAGTVGEYTTSGATVNASLITGLFEPGGIAVSGSDLFVSSRSGVGEYTTSGATVNATLISSPLAWITVSGSDLFGIYITQCGGPLGECAGNIGEYTTSGATVNASLITGLLEPTGIAVSGSDLFVASGLGSIGKYTTSGATVNSFSDTSGVGTSGIAVSGSDLFVTNIKGTIGEYTTSGATVNGSLVTGLPDPVSIAIAPVPEPSTTLLLSVGIAGLAARRRCARGASVE